MKNDDNEHFTNKKASWIGIPAYIIGAIIGYFSVKYLGILFVFLFAAPILLGIFIPDWYIKRKNINYKLIKFIAWLNIFTWFLPPLGLLTGILTIKFANYDAEQKTKFRILGFIGITFSLINAIAGIILAVL